MARGESEFTFANKGIDILEAEIQGVESIPLGEVRPFAIRSCVGLARAFA